LTPSVSWMTSNVFGGASKTTCVSGRLRWRSCKEPCSVSTQRRKRPVAPGKRLRSGARACSPRRRWPGCWGVSLCASWRTTACWRQVVPETAELVHDFTDATWNTRFLGDLYQDLSEDARKRYALLQTPEFVEEFILDRMLEPAMEVFGLKDVRLIDPTCGSGH